MNLHKDYLLVFAWHQLYFTTAMNRIRFSALDSNELAGIAKSQRHNYKKRTGVFKIRVYEENVKWPCFVLAFGGKLINA